MRVLIALFLDHAYKELFFRGQLFLEDRIRYDKIFLNSYIFFLLTKNSYIFKYFILKVKHYFLNNEMLI